MYANRGEVKQHVIPVRLDDEYTEKLELLLRLKGGQRAAVARELLEELLDAKLALIEQDQALQKLAG